MRLLYKILSQTTYTYLTFKAEAYLSSIALDVFNFVEEHLLEVLSIIDLRLSIVVVECFLFVYLQFNLVRST